MKTHTHRRARTARRTICKKLHASKKPKLSMHEARLVRALHEEAPRGEPGHWGYKRLAAKFQVHVCVVIRICRYETYNELRAPSPRAA